MATIYNATDGPLPHDDEGRILGARTHLRTDDATTGVITEHVEAGRFIIVPDQPKAPLPGKTTRKPTPPTEEA